MINKWHARNAARAAAIIVIALCVSAFGGVESLFAPKADLWEYWTAHDAGSAKSIDHSGWDRFLASNVTAHQDGVNRIAYGNVDATRSKILDDYIARMTSVSVQSLSRPEQLAYWINIYNALTVKVVLSHYPVDSIRDIDISPGLFSDGPWDKKLVEIGGEPVSLNDIEHRILRPIWRDPRIHYAVNCASVGCPNLRIKAFTADNTERMLEGAARDYINNPRGVRVEDDSLVVSSIYAWFTDDFGGGVAGVLAHLRKYANPELISELDAAQDLEDAYDWTLNDARPN
jgi:hypothetical protein